MLCPPGRAFCLLTEKSRVRQVGRAFSLFTASPPEIARSVTETALNRPTGDDGQAPEMAKDEMASADAHPLAITHPPLMAFSGSETRTRHIPWPDWVRNQKQIQTVINLSSRYQALGAHVTPSMHLCAPAESPAAAGSYLGNPLSNKCCRTLLDHGSVNRLFSEDGWAALPVSNWTARMEDIDDSIPNPPIHPSAKSETLAPSAIDVQGQIQPEAYHASRATECAREVVI